jgi:CBS domain-containing protein
MRRWFQCRRQAAWTVAARNATHSPTGNSMRVRDLLSKTPRTVSSLTDRHTISDAVKSLVAPDTSAVLVTSEAGRPGILTRSDILRVWNDSSRKPFGHIVLKEAMTAELITAGPDDDLADSIATMLRARVGHLPVCESGRVIAVLRLKDLFAIYVEALNNELEHLNDYIEQLHDSFQD